MSEHGKVSQQRYYLNIKNLRLSRQGYLQGTSNLNMSQERKVFKQRYYRKNNNLGLCRTVLLSGNFESERVAAEEKFQKTILSEQ